MGSKTTLYHVLLSIQIRTKYFGKLTIALLLIAFVVGTQGFTPLRCDSSSCGAAPSCKAGFEGTDINGCCPICLADVGEECGGPWNVHGFCGGTLACQKDFSDFNAKGKCAQGIPLGGQCGENWDIQAMCQKNLVCKPESPNQTNRSGTCQEYSQREHGDF